MILEFDSIVPPKTQGEIASAKMLPQLRCTKDLSLLCIHPEVTISLVLAAGRPYTWIATHSLGIPRRAAEPRNFGGSLSGNASDPVSSSSATSGLLVTQRWHLQSGSNKRYALTCVWMLWRLSK